MEQRKRNSAPQEATPADPADDPRERWRLQSDRGPFSRAWQLAVLRYARLPDKVKVHRSSSVSGAAMKAVLKAIDDHAGPLRGWSMTYQALANETGFTRGHVIRIVRALRDELLLSVIPQTRGTGKTKSRFEIGWLNLEALVPADRRDRIPPRGRSDDAPGVIDPRPTTHQASSTTHTASTDDAPGVIHHMSAQQSAPEAPPPPPEWVEVGAALRKLGIGIWARLVNDLPERGLSPQRVAEEIAAYHATTKDCSPGLLTWRLQECDPDAATDPPTAFWSTDSKSKNPRNSRALRYDPETELGDF